MKQKVTKKKQTTPKKHLLLPCVLVGYIHSYKTSLTNHLQLYIIGAAVICALGGCSVLVVLVAIKKHHNYKNLQSNTAGELFMY